MGKREEAKELTRQTLLKAAKEEFILHGLLGMSTVDIAGRARVAHGTVFFHFETKENLVLEVLDTELLSIAGELHTQLGSSKDVNKLLTRYLAFLEREEDFFAVLARETPFYAPELRRLVLGREGAVRGYFYRALESGIAEGRYKRVDITMVLGFLFGTLNYYLALRDAYAPGRSVIRVKGGVIVQTFVSLISE